jgi:uncharacterized membrane protein YphA (DoxX/SURF4 family)
MPTGKNYFSNKTTNAMKATVIIIGALRLIAAIILLQTLYFKFTGHEQSVKLFTQLGMEPWGRIGTGVMELIASILLIYSRTIAWGALLGMGLMSGAIFFHLTKLGIVFDGDIILFLYAVITFLCCAILCIIYRNKLIEQIRSIISR